MYKIVNRAMYIVNHWKYSQPKRMRKGYYDCSALVWKGYKSYKHYNKKLGSGSYAKTAASLFDYLKEKNLLNYGVPYIGFWNKVDDIPWDKLPNKFVLKCNHGCAYNIICSNKDELDIIEAKKKLSKWLKEDFSEFNAEPHYSHIKRGIICEEYLGDGNSDFLIDYKIHCFNGKPKFVLICSGRAQRSAEYIYYDLNWDELPYSNTESSHFSKPTSFSEMIDVCNVIAKDFPFVRVDFYDINGRPYIGELTFVPAGGLDNTIPYEADVKIGKMFDISSLEKQ